MPHETETDNIYAYLVDALFQSDKFENFLCSCLFQYTGQDTEF